MKILEFVLPKNSWELLISSADKEEVGPELVNLVKHAYSSTPQGSFVNSIKDVIPSDWKIVDWDKDPDVDATVFYRANRTGENWTGYKIQGLGHDGQRQSKDKALDQIKILLNRPGWWMESSDAMEHLLKKVGLTPVSDERFLKALFNDPNLKMADEDSYVRQLQGGQTIRETVFGNPSLKKH